MAAGTRPHAPYLPFAIASGSAQQRGKLSFVLRHRLAEASEFPHFDGNEVCEGLESVWLLVERIEQRLRLSQIGGIEAFREPAVDWREKVAGFGEPPLVAPQPG